MVNKEHMSLGRGWDPPCHWSPPADCWLWFQVCLERAGGIYLTVSWRQDESQLNEGMPLWWSYRRIWPGSRWTDPGLILSRDIPANVRPADVTPVVGLETSISETAALRLMAMSSDELANLFRGRVQKLRRQHEEQSLLALDVSQLEREGAKVAG